MTVLEDEMNINKIIEKECLSIIETIGHENIRIDLIQTSNDKHTNTDLLFVEYESVNYDSVKITHIPTGKIVIGDSFKTQIENLKEALDKLEINLDNS